MCRLIKLPRGTPRHVSGDPDDDPIVQTALTSRSHYLVTADRDLLRLKNVRNVAIITAEKWAQVIDG